MLPGSATLSVGARQGVRGQGGGHQGRGKAWPEQGDTEHEGTIKRQLLGIVFHCFAMGAISPLRFEKNNRVRIPNGREKQAVSACRRARNHYAKTRYMCEHRLHALGMVFWRMDAPTIRGPQNHWAAQTTPRSISKPGGVIGELVNRRIHKSHELNFGDGLQPMRCRSYCHPCYQRF